MRIIKWADDELAKEIRQKIKEADGHCPCVLEAYRCPETRCICQKFLDAPAGTVCTCGLYKKIED